MTPVKQLLRHKPHEGIYGDCHRAALASILEMPIEDIPHFGDLSLYSEEEWARAERDWLLGIGYIPISLFYETDDLAGVLFSTGYLNPDTYGILGGTSRNGVGHSVVICNGAIVHDPSQDDSGIIGPMKDGRFWVTWFGNIKALASKESR
jgi:hypothetical protein